MNVIDRVHPLGWWRLLTAGVLVASAATLATGLFMAFGSDPPVQLGWDFHVAYLPAAESILEGESPYQSPNDPSLDEARFYSYPPQLAVALTPLTLLPVDAAVVVAVLASLASLLGALWLVGVRDVRCYAVVPLWGSSWNAIEMANLSALLVLLLAVVWRFRATLWPLATALGVIVSLKLFLLPMLFWAAATRRFRAAGVAIAVGLAVTFASWAAIGFAGLRRYPDLLARIAAQDSYSIADVAMAVGLGSDAGHLFSFVVVAGLVALCAILGRRGDEQRAFAVAVAAALALSPVVWLHYLALLIVPLGVARPRFTPIWLLPIVLWVGPRSSHGDGLEPFLPTIVTAILLTVVLTRPRGGSLAVKVAT